MDGKVVLYQIHSKRLLHQFAHSSSTTNDVLTEESLSVECVALCKQQQPIRWAASGGADGIAKIWDLHSGVLRCSCQHGEAGSKDCGVIAIRWHPSVAHLMITASLDCNLRVWDVRDGI